MKTSAKHIDLLDQVRGIAIIGVLLVHTLSTVFGYDTLPWQGWFRDFSSRPASFLCFFPLTFGQAGVPIFFVVSGFCIHLSFQRGQKWGDFFIRRFFRIYPAYFAALTFFALLLFAKNFHSNLHSHEVWTQLLAHIFLVYNFHPSTFLAINASFWSLAIEAQLYLLYPMLLVLAGKLGWRRTMLMLAVCELLIRGTAGRLMQTDDATNTTGEYIAWLFASSPLGYWFSWALGAFIADAFIKNQPLPFAKTSPVGWLVLAVGSYFVKPLYPFGFLLFAVAAAVVISRLLSGTGPKIKVPAGSLDVLKKVGLFSYSLYLLHQPLFFLYTNVINWAAPGGPRSPSVAFLLMLATLLAIVPFSILWYKLFELSGIGLGKRILQKMELRQPAAAGPKPLKSRTGPVMKPGYFLMIAALLALIIGSFFVSVKLTPPDPVENNNRAWSLATNPEAAGRNGVLAVKLAEDACRRTQYQQAIMVGTLAAAYAEAGRFDEAVFAAQQACVLAAKNGETNLLQRNQELLELYQNHQPYHERPVNPGK